MNDPEVSVITPLYNDKSEIALTGLESPPVAGNRLFEECRLVNQVLGLRIFPTSRS